MTAPTGAAAPQMEPQEDYVDGPSSEVLAGTELEYRYTRGNHYLLTFDREFHVSFAMLNHPAHDTPGASAPPPMTYRAREIRPGLVLVHWIVKEPGIHVSLAIDLTEKKIHVSAMMPPNRWEFFDTAEILNVTRTE